MLGRNLKSIWDHKASTYDTNFESEDISKYIISTNFSLMKSFFIQEKGRYLLDLGCGTGRDAIKFVENGFKVHGIDISSEMIKISKVRSKNAKIKGDISFDVLPIEKISDLKPQKFDGIYSSFGPLNCVVNIMKCAKDISELLQPGGYFITSMVNRFYLAEIIYYFVKLKPKEIFKRWIGNPRLTKLSRFFPVIYCNFFTPRQFYQFFKCDFTLEKTIGLPIFIPPFENRKKRPYTDYFIKKLLVIEELISKTSLFKALGDHFIIVMRKK